MTELCLESDLSAEYLPYAERLRGLLKPQRYEHSLSVARLARQLAEHYGLDAKKAELAGLLHDVAKHMDYDDMLAFCCSRGISASDSTALMHAPAGAAILREQWGINDEELLNAVASHTVARIGMSDLERVVYLADVAEEHRSFDRVEELRGLIFVDLDMAMLCNLTESIADLTRKNKYIAPESKEALAYYQKLNLDKRKGIAVIKDNKAVLELVINAIKEKKGEEVISMGLQGLTVIADYFVIASAQNNRQTQAIADNIIEKAEEQGISIAHLEGYQDGKWILLDLGATVVHIFLPETRQYYNLERLWADAPVIHY